MSFRGIKFNRALPAKREKFKSFEDYYKVVRSNIVYTIGADEPTKDIVEAIEHIYNLKSDDYDMTIKNFNVEYSVFRKLVDSINFVVPMSSAPGEDLTNIGEFYKKRFSIMRGIINDSFNADKTVEEMNESKEYLANNPDALNSILDEIREKLVLEMGYKYNYNIRIRKFVDYITRYGLLKKDLYKMIDGIIGSRKATRERGIDSEVSGIKVMTKNANIRNHKSINYRRIK